MGNPDGGHRDYVAGSAVAAFLRRSAHRLFGKTAAGGATNEIWNSIRAGPLRAVCALLAAAIVANGLTLWLARKEIVLWGLLLRGIGLGVALIGLRGPSDWESVRKFSILSRFFRRGGV